MEAFSFGSYYPGDSAIHRLDPRTKLLLGFVFLITTLTVGGFRGLAPVAMFVVLIYAVSRVPVRRVLSSMAPLLAIVVVVAVLNLFTDQSGRILWQLGFLQISEGSLHSAAFMACRLTLMMAGMSAITLTTPTLDLTAGFERLLAPFARVGLPAHELGMIMGIALRFMPQFATEMKQTADAQASRGARVTGGPLGGVRMLGSVAIPLFTGVFRHAETLSAAHGCPLLSWRAGPHTSACACIWPRRCVGCGGDGAAAHLRHRHQSSTCLGAIRAQERGPYDRQRPHGSA